jgi:hypothetical protein
MSIQIKLFTERLSAVSQQYVDYRRVPTQNDVTVPNQPRKILTQERHFGLTAQVRVCDHRPIAHTDLMNMLIARAAFWGHTVFPRGCATVLLNRCFFNLRDGVETNPRQVYGIVSRGRIRKTVVEHRRWEQIKVSRWRYVGFKSDELETNARKTTREGQTIESKNEPCRARTCDPLIKRLNRCTFDEFR